ncbi:inositol 2-dehydrogenase/d-chiro-inositol 3-dehydrogenase [Citrus sinensis]|uniref:Inositol 2-dehydrogenase/d-chiro-inositol 3-dehydrogenase n=1 Tax=Citrus sinensis TaxID=2711 RepID=A0ACB8LUJ3_CITSI|nr:inositol 2-dehydrogenase/d-chiro-inositol 3-dehydrogenase [Citrus sinensis]
MAANDTVKYGIIGMGMMGREHFINLHHLRSQGVSVVCIADPHLQSRQQALKLANAFDWPLKVVDAARKRPDILVQVGLEYRYMPPVAKLIQIVKSGSIGQVKMVAIREHRFPFLVKVNDWNRFNENTGGTLVEKCCHFFDLMRLFVGSNPMRVMASGAVDVNHKDEMYNGKVPDIIDNAYVIVEFENGSRGMLDLCMFAEGSKNEQEIVVVGNTGKGEAFVPESIVRFATREAGREDVQTLKAEDDRIEYEGLHHGSSYLEHLNFLSAIRAKGAKVPAVDLQDGLISVAIGVAAQLSIEKGRFIAIEEVMEELNCIASA